MKKTLRTTCIFGTLLLASAAAANLSRAGAYELSQADTCQANCRVNTDACNSQCSDPEEQQQCIVNCDKAACQANCKTFEDNCKRHCPSPGG
jgi:hypothetical protein